MTVKEIGKLLELLNEYENTLNPNQQIEWTELGVYSTPDLIHSKRFGFIQRLVEQDKIELEAGPLYGCQLIMHNRQPYTLYETLLMLLSISDTPIEDLISYLK